MNTNVMHIYPKSKHTLGDTEFYMMWDGLHNMLAVSGSLALQFEGDDVSFDGKEVRLCPLTVENSKMIRQLFDFTNPKSHKGHNISFGLGDRLGLASVGHIQLVRELDVFPVLAQQSMRELNLTNRTYDDVLASAVWAVFREGYTKGYGADGDHLKTQDEVIYALECGYSMITLDCSEHIRNDITDASKSKVDALYKGLPTELTYSLESRYLNKSYQIDNDVTIEFDETDFKRTVLVYYDAIIHAAGIYDELIKGKSIDYEISIDETLSVTSPQSHFFVANELITRGVEFSSLAPRFIGQFQKGIDYIGDISDFKNDFIVHAKIAKKLGYRLSIHSGSDKFSVFPIIHEETDGKYHIKTAGTNWLEAVRVIAEQSPELYREIHRFALEHLVEAKVYYQITEDVSKIADIEKVSDKDLSKYLDQDDARQVLHVTYGLLLTATKDDGTSLFRDRIYDVLTKHESDYIEALKKHIGKHLTALGISLV